MTIHKSKGLEAAVVFLYGGFGRYRASGIHEYHEDGQRVLYIGDNDHAKEKANEDRSREEQRLYYVALTRAKARLYLPLVPDKLGGKRWDGGYRRLNERLSAVASNLGRLQLIAIYSGLSTSRIVLWKPGETIRIERAATWRRGSANDVLEKKAPRLAEFLPAPAEPCRLHRLIVFADEARREW